MRPCNLQTNRQPTLCEITQGTEIAGNPHTLNGRVLRSSRSSAGRSCSGFAFNSSIAGAGIGIVGVISTSTSGKYGSNRPPRFFQFPGAAAYIPPPKSFLPCAAAARFPPDIASGLRSTFSLCTAHDSAACSVRSVGTSSRTSLISRTKPRITRRASSTATATSLLQIVKEIFPWHTDAYRLHALLQP